MNTVCLGKTRIQAVTNFAGLLVLAALAIAFFAFPMVSFAKMSGCGGGGTQEVATLKHPLGLFTIDKDGTMVRSALSAGGGTIPLTFNLDLVTYEHGTMVGIVTKNGVLIPGENGHGSPRIMKLKK